MELRKGLISHADRIRGRRDRRARVRVCSQCCSRPHRSECLMLL